MYIEEWVLQAYLRREAEEELTEVLLDSMAAQIAMEEDRKLLQEIAAISAAVSPSLETDTKIELRPFTKEEFVRARKLRVQWELNLGKQS
jgi:hypothetical protein